MNNQQHCPLFKLPPELRNSIYKYVFHTGPQDTEILFTAAEEPPAPKLDLALTYRQARDEAMHVHQSYYKSYWAKNTFTFLWDIPYNEHRITAKQIQHTTKITVNICALDTRGQGSLIHFVLTANESPQVGDNWTISLTPGRDFLIPDLAESLNSATELSETGDSQGPNHDPGLKKRVLDSVLAICRRKEHGCRRPK